MRPIQPFIICLLFYSSLLTAGEWECPLRLGKPVINQSLLSYVEPIEFLIQQPVCAKWKKTLIELREKIIRFHELTTQDPKALKEETRLLAKELTDIALSTLLNAEGVIQRGELCSQKTLTQAMENAFVQLVRSLYAIDERARQIAVVSGSLLELTKTVPETIKRIRNIIEAERALRESNFVRNSCDFLNKKRQQECPVGHSQGDRSESQNEEGQRNALAINVFARLSDYQSRLSPLFESNTFLENLVISLKLMRSQPQLKDPYLIREAYYDFVVPSLKMCSLLQQLSRSPQQKKNYHKYCAPFFCDELGLLPNPVASTDPRVRGDAFCNFADNYRNIESRYLIGFQEHFQENRNASKKTYCPKEPLMRRLPPAGQTHAQ